MKRRVREVLKAWEQRGDVPADAVKAVKMYARVTNASPAQVAQYASDVAKNLQELSAALWENRQ